jgi:nitronate monooxygenase
MAPKVSMISELLGIDVPIIQAPMAGVQGSAMCIAVSNAGGLGSLPCALLSLDAMRAELGTISAQTTKPYNVNFFCHNPPVPDPAREARWRARLAPYFVELGIDADSIPAGSARMPFSHAAADVLSEFQPPVVSFHFGLPKRDLVHRVRSWGAKVMSSATTVEEARWLESEGVDIVVAQGADAGGHRGMFLSEDLDAQLGTAMLLSQILDAVSVPIVAAGGIADAKAVSEAIARGAAGVQVGTAYLLCPEATTSPVHREALKSEAAHTEITNVFTGRPARGIVNRLMRDLGPISPDAPAFPLAASAIAPLRAAAEQIGRDDFSSMWAGTNMRRCREISAADLTRELATQLRRL